MLTLSKTSKKKITTIKEVPTEVLVTGAGISSITKRCDTSGCVHRAAVTLEFPVYCSPEALDFLHTAAQECAFLNVRISKPEALPLGRTLTPRLRGEKLQESRKD